MQAKTVYVAHFLPIKKTINYGYPQTVLTYSIFPKSFEGSLRGTFSKVPLIASLASSRPRVLASYRVLSNLKIAYEVLSGRRIENTEPSEEICAVPSLNGV